jgi:diacylglycerol kinase (ATP)
MTAFVVVNPHAAGGRTGREWPGVEAALRAAYPDMTAVFTDARGQATALVRQALEKGCVEIVAVGGDGTINEAVNGFFDAERTIAPDAVLGFVTSGTGGDFRKTFGVPPGHAAAIARLKEAPVARVDVGRVTCQSSRGEAVVRYFANIASFGLSGAIADAVNRARIAKLLGGQFAFAFHSALAMLSHRDRAVRIRIDGHPDDLATISTVAIANGRFFGGGMHVAPQARPDDGLFDVVILGGAPAVEALRILRLVYSGEHLQNPHVRCMRARTVVAEPDPATRARPVLIEVDGESAGQLPATFNIVPRALNLRC